MVDTQFLLRTFWAILLLIGIWLLLSIPAYAALSVWLQLSEALRSLIDSLWRFVSKTWDRLTSTGARLREELQQRLNWFEIDESAKAAWLESVDQVWATATTNALEVRNARRAASDSLKVLQPLLARLKNLKLVSQSVPQIPDLSTALEASQRSRTAFTELFIASILLVLIVPANAQMTGLVLSEVIPPVRPLLGIPIPLLIAAVLVIAEAGIGVLHSSEAESRSSTERTFTIMTAVWTVAAIGVIGIEALLYGYVQPSNVVSIPLAGSVFGLVGGLLGLAVFGLGRLWHHSLITVRKERTPKTVSKQLVRLQHAAEEWNAVAERAAPHQDVAVARFEQLTNVAKEAADLQTTALTKAHAEFERHRVAMPAWAKVTERQLTGAELQRREAVMYVSLLILTVATASLVTIAAFAARRVGPTVGEAVGLGTAMAALAVGVFAGQLIPRTGRSRVVGALACLALVVLVTATAARYIRGEFSWHGLVLSVPAVAACLSGLQIGPDAALLRLPVWWLARSLTLLPLLTVLSVAWAAALVAAVVKYALMLLAWPVLAVVNRRRSARPEGLEHAAV